jgi:hypothetical protein
MPGKQQDQKAVSSLPSAITTGTNTTTVTMVTSSKFTSFTPPVILLLLFGTSVACITFVSALVMSPILMGVEEINQSVNMDSVYTILSSNSYLNVTSVIVCIFWMMITALWDRSLLGCVTGDGIFMSISFSVAIYSTTRSIEKFYDDMNMISSSSSSSSSSDVGLSNSSTCYSNAFYVVLFFATIIAGWINGMIAAGAERFAIGYILHAVPSKSYQESHEACHERLRQRKLNKSYNRSDDWHEILGFLILYVIRYVVLYQFGIIMSNMTPNSGYHVWQCGYLLGLSTEQYFGQLFRVYLQYIPYYYLQDKYTQSTICQSFKCKTANRKWRFLLNAHHYYWYHLLVNSLQCSGFSAPGWDDLWNRNPVKRSGWNKKYHVIWSFFPWIDFIMTDYDDSLRESLAFNWNQYVIQSSKKTS